MHPGHLCSAVKSAAAHLLRARRVTPVEGLDVAGEGEDKGITVHGRPDWGGHGRPPCRG
jgi:hypothetical protein